MSNTTEQQIANDLNKIDLILAIGSKKAKKAAMKQRDACYAAIHESTAGRGFDDLTDDELLDLLMA